MPQAGGQGLGGQRPVVRATVLKPLGAAGTLLAPSRPWNRPKRDLN